MSLTVEQSNQVILEKTDKLILTFKYEKICYFLRQLLFELIGLKEVQVQAVSKDIKGTGTNLNFQNDC